MMFAARNSGAKHTTTISARQQPSEVQLRSFASSTPANFDRVLKVIQSVTPSKKASHPQATFKDLTKITPRTPFSNLHWYGYGLQDIPLISRKLEQEFEPELKQIGFPLGLSHDVYQSYETPEDFLSLIKDPTAYANSLRESYISPDVYLDSMSSLLEMGDAPYEVTDAELEKDWEEATANQKKISRERPLSLPYEEQDEDD